MELVEGSVTSPETFEYLRKFRNKHRDIIEKHEDRER